MNTYCWNGEFRNLDPLFADKRSTSELLKQFLYKYMTIFWNNQIFCKLFLWNRAESNHHGLIFSQMHWPTLLPFHCWSEWCRTTIVGTRIRSNTVILHSIVFFFVVEAGLKHAISALRGRWLNQFVYSTVLSLLSDSNQRPMGYDAIALPSWAKEAICWSTRTRTQKKRFGISHVTITSWTSINRAV